MEYFKKFANRGYGTHRKRGVWREEKRREEKRDTTDTGLYITRIHLQPTEADTFHSMAYKVYEYEISLLVQSLEMYENALKEYKEPGSVLPPEVDPTAPDPLETMTEEEKMDIIRRGNNGELTTDEEWNLFDRLSGF